MATAVSSKESKPYSDINMTPLIDVMLVLLIIFIITIPSQTHAVKIDNPLHAEPPPTRPEVHIAVDKYSKYEIVAQTLADLQYRGLKKIGFVNNEFF